MAETTARVRSLSAAGALATPGQEDVLRGVANQTAAPTAGRDLLSPSQRTLLSLLASHATGPFAAQPDWAELAALAQRLWLEPRLAARVADDPRIPTELRARWLDARRSTAARNLLFQSEEKRLLEALAQAGMEAVPLKGTSLARILGDPAARPVTDIDLGVRVADVGRAAQALRDDGYQVALPDALLRRPQFLASTDEYTSEIKCARDRAGSRLVVEVHWKWLPLPEELIWSSLRVYEPAGVRTLSVEQYFLFLCSHAAGGGWAGLRWLCDICEWLAALGSSMDTALCLWLARQAGLRRAAGITLALLDDFFAFRLPGLEPLRDGRARREAKRYHLRPFQPFLTGTVTGIHRDRLRIQDDTARRVAYAARLLLPTFQEWLDHDGRLRPAAAAWALRAGRLAKLSFAAVRPSTPSAEAQR